ncbi:MAG TPA: hypothetical protein VHT97_05585 [Acidimicrobiales bacterium]|nr:hypothetical protein [Acidimicrobiales bacterium]
MVSTITEGEARRDEYLGKIGAATYDHDAEHLFELDGADRV